MSESKHTPGPWYATYDLEQGRHWVSQQPQGGTFWIAEVLTGCIGDETDANALLIAAAPEVAESLQEALRWIGSLTDWAGAGDPDVEKWRAAIKKATEVE